MAWKGWDNPTPNPRATGGVSIRSPWTRVTGGKGKFKTHDGQKVKGKNNNVVRGRGKSPWGW
jgi:hypothetical protein